MHSAPTRDNRCQFVFADGRRCRMRCANQSDSLCYQHWRREQQQAEAERAGEEIVAAADALNTQEAIHKALGNVFRLLARNRVSPRHAAVLGYVGQMMLVNLPSFEHTMKSLLPMLQLSLRFAQHNQNSQAAEADRLHKHAILEVEVTNRLVEQFQMFNKMSDEERLRFAKFVLSYSEKKEDMKKEGAPSAKS